MRKKFTLDELEQIIYIKSEVEVLSKRLAKAKKSEFVSDYAKDYSSGFERIITISGYAITDSDKVDKIHTLLECRRKELEDKVLEAEVYIASIPDSKIRTLLTLRFLEGKEWEETAKSFYKKMSADSARKTIVRYFDKI
jgi:hypothetical protein